MNTIKIGFVGPQNTGKTTIAEYYTELTPEPNFEYKPTQGLRILETERKVDGSSAPVAVQIWDTSGDPQYEMYFSKISMQLDGVVIVCPGTDLRLTSTCKKYYQLVVNDETVGKFGHVICMLHKPNQPVSEEVYIEDKQLAQVPVYRTCMEGDRNQINEILDGLVEKIVKKQRDEGDFFE